MRCGFEPHLRHHLLALPSCRSHKPWYPNGRGRRLRIGALWVRVPPRACANFWLARIQTRASSPVIGSGARLQIASSHVLWVRTPPRPLVCLGIPTAEDVGSEPMCCGFESHPRHFGPVAQSAEAADLKSVCCGFESHLGYSPASAKRKTDLKVGFSFFTFCAPLVMFYA